MKKIRYIMTLLLLSATVMSSLAVQSSTADHGSRPTSGCHEHGKSSPAPPHSDYACCVAGHGFAVVQASFDPRFALQVLLNIVSETDRKASPAVCEIITLPFLPDFPPGSMPLRV